MVYLPSSAWLLLVSTVSVAGFVTDRLPRPAVAAANDTIALVNCENVPLLSCQLRLPPTEFDDASLDEWFATLTDYRNRIRDELSREVPLGDFRAYDDPAIQWAKSSFIQPQVMVHDKYLYDRARDEWTVDKYLDDLETRYGGIDAVLLWQGYPNIGVDDRNQFDLIRSLPGGIEGAKALVAAFQARRVKVFWPYFLWDSGTRNEGKSDYEALVGLVIETGADGINGDTCDGINRTWWEESVALGKGLALESQSMGSRRYQYDTGWENVTVNVMSWAENWPYTEAPLVSAYKAIEPRHMVQIVERFAENRTNGLQHAFFNGIGYETWENIWNMFNKITPRDSEAIRRISSVLSAVADIVMDADVWRPFVPGIRLPGVYGSRFEKAARQAYLVVNRRPYAQSGAIIELDCAPGTLYFDMWHGQQFSAAETACDPGGKLALRFHLEAHGYGAVLAVDAEAARPSPDYLLKMRTMTADSLDSFSALREFLPQTMSPIPATEPPRDTANMVLVEPPGGDANGVYDFECKGNIQQGDLLPTIVDVQFPFEESPQRNHRQLIELAPFWVDIDLVTNDRYKRFLDATGWKPPADEANWLRHWTGTDPDGARTFPAGWAEKPVQWVSRTDAAALCAAEGKRLPHTWEWQFAAQGAERRRFPWGNDADASRIPTPSSERDGPVPDDVGSHPTGNTVGTAIRDLVGNMFQWTSEFVDEHSVMAVVRGGSSYYPHENARYYFPVPVDTFEHNTLLSMSDSMDRSGGISFRCVADADRPAPTACPWQLCGRYDAVETGTVVDLTTEGSVAWSHWGLESVLDVSRKSSGKSRIAVSTFGDAPQLGLFVPIVFPGTPVVNYRWTDGAAPTPTGVSGRGILVSQGSGPNIGFTITVQTVEGATPTGATKHTIKVYAGVFSGTARLTASSAGGASVYTETLTAGSDAVTKGVFTIEYRPTDSWPLQLDWRLVGVTDSNAHVSLFAVTLTSK